MRLAHCRSFQVSGYSYTDVSGAASMVVDSDDDYNGGGSGVVSSAQRVSALRLLGPLLSGAAQAQPLGLRRQLVVIERMNEQTNE